MTSDVIPQTLPLVIDAIVQTCQETATKALGAAIGGDRPLFYCADNITNHAQQIITFFLDF